VGAPVRILEHDTEHHAGSMTLPPGRISEASRPTRPLTPSHAVSPREQ
jgi:hypothetical protein